MTRQGCATKMVESSALMMFSTTQRVFIWGSAYDGKLLLNSARVQMWDDQVDSPIGKDAFVIHDPQDITHLFPRHVGIVQLVAGGASFLARDHEGQVWGWGRVKATEQPLTEGNPFDPFSMMGSRPFKIDLPCKAVDLASNDLELSIVDEYGRIWNLYGFGLVSTANGWHSRTIVIKGS